MFPAQHKGTRMMTPNAAGSGFLRLASGLVAVLFTLLATTAAAMTSKPEPQRSFATPQQAVTALATAVKDNSDQELLAILGVASADLISSGDKVADRNGRARFYSAYQEKHSLKKEGDQRVVLIVGESDYPFPIPLVRERDIWRFDTEAGKREILYRRIGKNELRTIEVMQAYTDAQREYASMDHGDEGSAFAQKLTSTPGKRDGLYWEVGEDEQESPLGPLIARAAEENYGDALAADPPEPFHGYYFRIIKAQGKNADGGAFDYLVNGEMALGFALVAYPAKYGASGIMTFIVNQEGVIYEQDLGQDTAALAASITAFDPDESWRKYQAPQKP